MLFYLLIHLLVSLYQLQVFQKIRYILLDSYLTT
nr:MAG TPA: hypothetical protein [Caudoviricetes sp.]